MKTLGDRFHTWSYTRNPVFLIANTLAYPGLVIMTTSAPEYFRNGIQPFITRWIEHPASTGLGFILIIVTLMIATLFAAGYFTQLARRPNT